ncbi:MAG TPA: YbhB/YbcL family Raf kinase inhibitor-like protein [Planctomycetota bacterium]|nr:YbhB/YbcL family Raf kinase inhibitor-like protein [Planctomycetota bacterium]
MPINLTSPAFETNAPIPKKFTGEGENMSPPLEWSGVPKGAKQLALICEDPDAPVREPFVHWVMYGIPADVTELPEDVKAHQVPGAVQGRNSFDCMGYSGPMPPRGHGPHHYHFRLYALDRTLDLPSGLDKAKLLAAMKRLIIEESELVGTYERQKEAVRRVRELQVVGSHAPGDVE